MRKSRRLVALFLMVALVTTAGGDRLQPARAEEGPESSRSFTGHPGILTEWGAVGGTIYAVLAPEREEQQELLLTWQWEDGKLQKVGPATLPRSLHILPVDDGLCSLSLGQDEGGWPTALVKREDGTVVKQWSHREGWSVEAVGCSVGGEYVGLLVAQGAMAPGWESGKEERRMGLIDVKKRELKWVATHEGKVYGSIRKLSVSKGGEYIAVAGWDGGTAMFDARKGELLWAEKPEEEAGTREIVFAEDKKRIYTTGTAGCVYVIDMLTGEIRDKLWATPAGESIYGLRATALAMSNDGKWLAAGLSPTGEVSVWNLETGEEPVMLKHGRRVSILCFSPEAEKIATVGGGSLKVWNYGAP